MYSVKNSCNKYVYCCCSSLNGSLFNHLDKYQILDFISAKISVKSAVFLLYFASQMSRKICSDVWYVHGKYNTYPSAEMSVLMLIAQFCDISYQ